MRAKIVLDVDGDFIGVSIDCPGCKHEHMLPVSPMPDGYKRSQYYREHNTWQWNGSLEVPTFHPSISVKSGHYASGYVPGDPCWCTFNAEHHEEDDPSFVCVICHSFVRDGKIEFLGDCTHELKNQTVVLPEKGA